MSCGRRRGLRSVSPYAIVLALAIALTASFFLPLRAEAAISDHTVPTISPSGTTINLFDYWVNPDNHLSVSGNGGINKNHRFQFKDQGASEELNQYTGGSRVRTGIVNNVLAGGYPILTDRWEGESLGYLFDSSVQTGKISHMGVTGLLQAKGGYYEYDSSRNYAAYNANKNAFDVYNAAGVMQAGAEPHSVGQFFPFDAADEVFKEEDGKLVPNGITSQNNGPLNHYFGLSMSSRFVQPKDGKTNADKPMTFEFAGDDDVWVFIDDVLVGDIGGIHTSADLTINFQTGDISVNNSANGTLKSKFKDAGRDISGFNGNTFADGTSHTLKFFYLERGATDSNMKLKYNLVTVPESDIIKFDQDGGLVEGAQFALYKTDERFTDTTTDQKYLLGSGTTDADGQLTLTNDDDNGVINFDDLYKLGCRYYLLKETKVPEGYRSSLTATDGSMQFEYVPTSDKGGAGGVIINRGGMDQDSVVWKNGAFAGAKETITAPSTVYQADDDSMKPGNTVDMKRGTLFAVVFKRDKSKNAWHAVSGDPTKGYTLAGAQGMAGAIEAAKKDLYAFTLNTSGQYQVEIPYLPGDISKYYYLLSGDARKNAEYAVAIYYTAASSIADANTDNTVHVFSDDLPGDQVNFKRQFATSLLVTNIQNRLFVQKTDTEGNPVDGAKFGLYTDGQVTTDANGKVVLNGDQIPYDTLTTGQVSNPIQLEGAGIFPCTSDGNKPLVKGAYFLKEVSAPKGFLLNDTLTKVIVDDYGVHADAGTADDGVSTFVGPGTLMKSLGQFGAEGDIDNTLTWIKGMRQTSDGVTDGGNLSWSDVDSAGAGDTVHLKYGANGRIYQYGPTKAGEPYRLETETGWIRMGITQDEPGVTNAKGARADLGDMNLNALFTGATCVRVANEREASLEVTKKVDVPDGLTGNKDAGFTFKFTVPEGKTYKAAVFEKAGTAGERRVGNVFNLTNGYSQTIKADETIRVYGLSEGDEYTVQELTGADQMPAGYKLTGRKQGDKNLTEEGDSISGRIAPQNSDGTVAKDNKLVFTNTYTAEASDKLTPQVTKKISGTERTDKKFSFTLAATSKTKDKIDAGDLEDDGLKGDTPSESKTTKGEITGKDGQPLNFSDMTFNKAGDYTFTLTEAYGEDDDPNTTGVQNAGWTMDDSTYTVTVKVEDKNAKLTVTGVAVEKDGDDKSETLEVKKGKVNLATFTNSYAAKGSVTLAAKKHFTGGALAENDFSFALYKGDKAEGTPLEIVTNDENGNITFQPINYTEAGDYDYTIKEVKGADLTVVYDGQEVKVKVSVTDNKNGTLGATATYGGDEAVPTFTNSKPTADVTVEATKVLAGKDLTADAFTFGLYDQDGNEDARGTNDKNGKVKLTVKGLNLGEYDYTLKEVAGSDSTITYDSTEVRVHVSVKAEGDKAKATVTYDGKNDIPTFKNTYQPAETSVTLAAKKAYVKSDSTPAALKGGEFAFGLYEGDLTAEQLKGKQPIRSAKNGEDGTVTFPAINYTKAGEYKYTIVEKKGDLSHVTFDDAVHHAAVKVMDKAGKLDAAVAYDGDKDDAPTFTNTYTAKGSVELTATKVVAVAPGFTHDTKLKGGEYTFELKDADGKVLDTAKNEADGTVKFTRDFELADLGGAASKDFAYTIAEKPGAEAGMVYDNHTLSYTVTVTDDGAGTLTATPQVTSGDKTFTNTYRPKETSVTLKATKRFTGGELAGSDFTFQLLDKDGSVVQTVQNEKDGKVAFAAIDYATPGDHDYTIKEVKGADSTVVYDAKGVKVHVKVTDEKGELKATVTYDGEKAVPTFTNTKPTADVTVEATKVLAGKDLTADAFTFGLYDQDGNEDARGTNDKNGKVKLTVKGLNLGEYDYTLKEEKAGQSVDGVAYDAKEVKVHVKVEQNQDDNNKTKVTVTYDGTATAPTFNNTYTAKGSVELTATKTIKVADGFDHTTKPADGEFTFDLKDAAGNVIATAKNDANGKVCFTREFQLSDLDGAASKDFTYTIVEQPGAEPGMVYDNHALTYTVTVTDGGNGALNAKAIVMSASGSDTFTNTYQPAATGLALGAQKSYVKKDDNTPIVPKDGEFTFDVYEGKMTAEQLAGAKPVRTATNGADGSVNFDAFSYAKPGTYEYTIVERKGDLAYVTYDDAVHHAVVTVVDNAGTLQASVAYDGADATKPTFTNTYKAKATNSGAIALTKSVDVHDGSYQLKAGDFAFELVGSDGTVLQTQKNDAKGKVYFNELTFDHAGTFPFTVREVQPTDGAPGVPGVTYTGKTYTLTYVVKDNNDGKLVVESSTVKPSEGTENGVTPNTMTFANSYQPGQTSYQISGTKVLENADPATTRTPADGEFTFALIDVATGQEIDRTTNVGKAFTFKAISYTATGSHAYQVKEVAGQDGTITYSDAVLDVTVNVTDDGSGQLTATANKTAADLTFTNTYTPTATTVTITGTKALTGRDLAEGEFFFDLKDADGNVVQTVQNGADGTFGFAPLQLDKVGTYVYTVSERAGATANGVTYDTTVFTATVTVTENAETHALEAQVAYSKGGKAADAVAFSNSYAPAATEVKLGASKVLSGEDLKEGQFSFQLKDADGKVLQTAKNAADGTVGFEAISYDKPGTYAYSISEVDDGQKNVTYDAAEHRVTVTVTDDGAGHLVATVTYDGAVAPVFKNTYTPPTTPPTEPPTNPPSKSPVPKEEKPGLPYTGDTSLSPMALGGIAGGAVVLIAAGVILRRRNR
ncbi:FctA domain-containing protein [Collinsella sp. BG-O-102]|uniref:Spy0128 family protein n=1 Tax=Collinsella sp. BG-O-102 TaxID=2949659 RepID=UPI00202DC0C5|nr:FctA domain-containing protein [Collinsella sp. BG-O-102]MCM0709971.1 SpaA isopeptide-forming pilin-related protein [Collinsella sp. BG-O-102]